MAVEALGHAVSHTVVAELLHGLGYSLQSNVKTREGRQHSDRDAQFRSIARQVRAAQRRQQPTISVDTKKKELVGPFKNGGRAWRPTKTPQRVRAHDFVILGAGGKAIPYGVDDPHRNEGWVSVGIDHDMATFAVRSIRRWWQHMRRPVYRDAVTLLITADAGPTASTARRSRSARSFPSTSAGTTRRVPPSRGPRGPRSGSVSSGRRKRRITMADCRSAGRENARGGVPRMQKELARRCTSVSVNCRRQTLGSHFIRCQEKRGSDNRKWGCLEFTSRSFSAPSLHDSADKSAADFSCGSVRIGEMSAGNENRRPAATPLLARRSAFSRRRRIRDRPRV